MFCAWRLVKQKRIFNTNKFSVDSEKTSGKVQFRQKVLIDPFAAVIADGNTAVSPQNDLSKGAGL